MLQISALSVDSGKRRFNILRIMELAAESMDCNQPKKSSLAKKAKNKNPASGGV
jgi:hypothetical protein